MTKTTTKKPFPLGQKTIYEAHYNPALLFPIARAPKREDIGVDPKNPPFYGFDYWNHYEVSWLNEKGKPEVATAVIIYDCTSPMLIESKSLKLYFNSFNNHTFANAETLINTIKKDLDNALQSDVTIFLNSLDDTNTQLEKPQGTCLDNLDITCDTYTVNPDLLKTENEDTQETLYSDLLKSNCLVTGQPDWGTLHIEYSGKKINHDSLLRYIVSYRNHNEFHEQCIERIFNDVMTHCQPKTLTVYGRYTRRGGIDINPYRSTEKTDYKNKNTRLIRQ